MKRISVTVTEQLIEQLSKLKRITGLGKSEIIRRALEEYLEEQQAKQEKRSES